MVRKLLTIIELKEVEWNWGNIMSQLDFNFIKTNISNVNFDLSELTVSKKESVLQLIEKYPTRNWDWVYISEEYELPFILKNISEFSENLDLKKILNRAFISEDYINLFCE